MHQCNDTKSLECSTCQRFIDEGCETYYDCPCVYECYEVGDCWKPRT